MPNPPPGIDLRPGADRAMNPWSARQAVILANLDRVGRARAKVLGAAAESLQVDFSTRVDVVLDAPLPWRGALLPAGAVLTVSPSAAADLIHAREGRGERIDLRTVVAPESSRFRRT